MATKYQAGCYADGCYGHQHTREVCAATVDVIRQARDLFAPPNGTIEALNANMSDDADEERLACDWLNVHAPLQGHWWGWQDGDFGLWPEDDRETLT